MRTAFFCITAIGFVLSFLIPGLADAQGARETLACRAKSAAGQRVCLD